MLQEWQVRLAMLRIKRHWNEFLVNDTSIAIWFALLKKYSLLHLKIVIDCAIADASPELPNIDDVIDLLDVLDAYDPDQPLEPIPEVDEKTFEP